MSSPPRPVGSDLRSSGSPGEDLVAAGTVLANAGTASSIGSGTTSATKFPSDTVGSAVNLRACCSVGTVSVEATDSGNSSTVFTSDTASAGCVRPLSPGRIGGPVGLAREAERLELRGRSGSGLLPLVTGMDQRSKPPVPAASGFESCLWLSLELGVVVVRGIFVTILRRLSFRFLEARFHGSRSFRCRPSGLGTLDSRSGFLMVFSIRRWRLILRDTYWILVCGFRDPSTVTMAEFANVGFLVVEASMRGKVYHNAMVLQNFLQLVVSPPGILTGQVLRVLVVNTQSTCVRTLRYSFVGLRHR